MRGAGLGVCALGRNTERASKSEGGQGKNGRGGGGGGEGEERKAVEGRDK